jgi:cytochrome c
VNARAAGRTATVVCALVMTSALTGAVIAAGGDAQAGKQIFQRRCAGCHVSTPGASGLGPDLNGIIGRKAGSGTSGVHSRALLEKDLVWNEQTLRKYLSAPAEQVPGGNMPLVVVDPAEIDDVLAYLKTLK